MLLQKDIIFEDENIIVVHKPAGVATQTSRVGEKDMVSEVKNYLRKKNTEKSAKEPYLALIHRLDQPVEGILVMGKNPAAAAHLNKQLTEHMMDKHYLAGIYGTPPCKCATAADYLLKEEGTNLSRVVEQDTPGAKKAVLEFEITDTIAKEKGDIHLADIHLITGRHHQIRVQMSNASMPLLGDSKYGSDASKEQSAALGIRNVALCANRLSFLHPITNERMEWSIEPKGNWYKEFMK